MKHHLFVGNKTWTYEVLNDAAYIVKFGMDSDAMTEPTPIREMYFKESALTEGTIRHELFHAFMFEVPIHSAALDMNQTLEVVAEWLEENHELYASSCNVVINKLLRKDQQNVGNETRYGEGTLGSNTIRGVGANSQGSGLRSEKV